MSWWLSVVGLSENRDIIGLRNRSSTLTLRLSSSPPLLLLHNIHTITLRSLSNRVKVYSVTMESDPKHNRRRANSSAVSLGRQRGSSKVVPQPKSSHTSDDFLHPFLNPSFDPASFLNSSLPPLQQRSTPDGSGVGELSIQAQKLLSQLNAHTTRLSNTLTSLADDILRSGSRLAYEVELLRGETNGLTETMEETLQEHIKKFLPEGVPAGDEYKKDALPGSSEAEAAEGEDSDSKEPVYVKQLKTLTTVRARLDSVIKTFGDAMEFTFPPSELSVSSSFLSVSAPEPGSAQQSSEEKGQQVLKNLRDEIAALLNQGEDPVEAIASAAQRIEQLKELNVVWKGTSEERGRGKFIEGLAKIVEEKHRELMKEIEGAAERDGGRPRKSSVTKDTAAKEDSVALSGGFGLLNQLQRLRSGI